MREVYAGLDVSDKTTQVCVVDAAGAVIWEGACATDPDVIARTLKARAPGLVRVVLETGPLSAFLNHGLAERGVPVICICARHAKGVLSARVNKSDVHDAEGLAQMARTGWFKAIRIKQDATHMERAHLKIREQLVDSHQVMAGQLRGLLKLFGLRDHMGRISKAGDPMLRSALYEAANVLLGRVKRPCALKDWGQRLAQAKGPKRARVAVARKLAVLLHRLWQSQTEFRWA